MGFMESQPVMYRKTDRGGHRVCDLQYDTESEERTLIFKLGGLRTEIPLRDLDRSFEDLIGDITDLDLKN
jgi:hypothetical protein